MTVRKRRRLTIAILLELIRELKSIRDDLPYAYMGDDDDEGGGAVIFDPHVESEDIEIGITAAVSTISQRCDLSDEPKDLAGLMEILFSPDDDLVSLAINLEDSINGYFGSLFGEDLQMARTYFGELITALEEKVREWKEKRVSQG